MDAHQITAQEVIPASRKLGRTAAEELARAARRVVVAKGGKVRELPGGRAGREVVEAMLGPTGNLRAPAVRAGSTVLVGFEERAWTDVLA